jgi:Leucine-rich repeat (LRR) protein
MRITALLFLVSLFAGSLRAQTDIRLGLCDDIPLGFYQRNLKSIQIENGMGYCISPVKLLDHRIANFKNLETLVYTHASYNEEAQFYSLPEEISELQKLKSLHTNIPNNEIFGLSNLKVLGLQIQDSATMDLLAEEGFFKLHLLEVLDLKISNGIPKNYEITGISGLQHLKKVYLMNPNQQLTNEVLENPNIEELTIQYSNGLSFDFSKMLALKKLKLDLNGLSEIPPSIYQLAQLEELDLSNNGITNISADIGALTNLRVLNIGRNKLTKLPAEIANCLELRTLNLSRNNDLKTLLSTLGNLTKLEELGVSYCGLSELPKAIEQCIHLKTLSANNNHLTGIDFSFKHMHQLNLVHLNNNQISFIDSSLFACASVRKLNLSRNKISALPASIGQMKFLEKLDITYNNISRLPEDLGQLHQLLELSAYYNKINQLPQSIIHLKKLRYLHLGNNELTVLPTGFEQLSGIWNLEIHNNPFVIFPTAIYGMKRLDMVWLDKEQSKLKGFLPSEKNPTLIIQD